MTGIDVTFWIAIAAIIISCFSAFYTRTLARNDTKRMLRKDLIIETRPIAVENQPDWTLLYITIRNLEPVSARISSITVNKGAQLLPDQYAYEEDDWGMRAPEHTLPINLCERRVAYKIDIGSCTSIPNSIGRGGPEILFQLYAYRWQDSCKLKLSWKWSDK